MDGNELGLILFFVSMLVLVACGVGMRWRTQRDRLSWMTTDISVNRPPRTQEEEDSDCEKGG